jgi:hypothetical protein
MWKCMLPDFVRRVSGDVTNYRSVVGHRVEVGTWNICNTKQDCSVRCVHVMTYCVCSEILRDSWLLLKEKCEEEYLGGGGGS